MKSGQQATEFVAGHVEPVTGHTEPAWCLPASGGRLLVLGYESAGSLLFDLEEPWGPRWALDFTSVAVEEDAADGFDAGWGEVYPGDCVVFVGTYDGSDVPAVWWPQRIIAVSRPSGHRQQVWALRDTSMYDTEVAVAALGVHRHAAGPLLGGARRAVLELFGLNIDCPWCGLRGREIAYVPPGRLPVAVPPFEIERGMPSDHDPRYVCGCGATWRVSDTGEQSIQEPHPTL